MEGATRYHLYLDECGNHDMRHIDPSFPVFVLVGLLVGERYYQKTLVPRVKQLKRDCLPNPAAVLHSSEIRRCEGAFRFLLDAPERKQLLYAALNNLFETCRIRLAAVVIHKKRLQELSLIPPNPYNISLSQLLSTLCGPPFRHPKRPMLVASLIAESRGKLEDKQLQSQYQILRRHGLLGYGAADVRDRRPATVQQRFPPRVTFLRKKQSVAGLELADLAAYPIARAAISGDPSNPAMQAISTKLRALIEFPFP